MDATTTSGVTITAHSRLHLTLLAMHHGEYRINGGIGFSILDPTCTISASKSPVLTVTDEREFPFSSNQLLRLQSALTLEQARKEFRTGISVTIGGEMPTHSGFGSGTAITLACLEALHSLNNSSPFPTEMVSASCRGGTSGVGINAYFTGGCVFDLGRRVATSSFVPSCQALAAQPPLVVDSFPMPDWDIGICIPLMIAPLTQDAEEAFFARTCPLVPKDVFETSYHTLFGLYAAAKEADWTAFCQALNAVQHCSWKRAERDQYGSQLHEIEQALYANGATAVGMSSLGPSLFFMADDVHRIVQRMQAVLPECKYLLTRPNNYGRSKEDV